MSVEFGELRSAIHARDTRALIEASYRKRRYILHELHERYISDQMPEWEREVYRWACAMIDYLLEHSSVPHPMVRGFAATWAEWVLGGAQGQMPVYLNARHFEQVKAGRWLSDLLRLRTFGGHKDHEYEHGLWIESQRASSAKGWEVLWA